MNKADPKGATAFGHCFGKILRARELSQRQLGSVMDEGGFYSKGKGYNAINNAMIKGRKWPKGTVRASGALIVAIQLALDSINQPLTTWEYESLKEAMVQEERDRQEALLELYGEANNWNDSHE